VCRCKTRSTFHPGLQSTSATSCARACRLLRCRQPR
jgi:hypothetical protein